MRDDYEVFPATADHIEELSLLVNSAYRGDSSRTGWTTEADLLDGQRTDQTMLREQIVGTRTILCLRRTGSAAIIGCVFLERKDDQAAYLGMLTIQPGLQAGGLGSLMLSRAEDLAKSWKVQHMILTVIRGRDTLIAWYRRRGYAETGHTSPFPYGDARFGMPKHPDLYFIEFAKRLI